jgi:hypothetical protein
MLKASEKFATAPTALLALPALQTLHEALPETLHRLLVSFVSDCQNKKTLLLNFYLINNQILVDKLFCAYKKSINKRFHIGMLKRVFLPNNQYVPCKAFSLNT